MRANARRGTAAPPAGCPASASVGPPLPQPSLPGVFKWLWLEPVRDCQRGRHAPHHELRTLRDDRCPPPPCPTWTQHRHFGACSSRDACAGAVIWSDAPAAAINSVEVPGRASMLARPPFHAASPFRPLTPPRHLHDPQCSCGHCFSPSHPSWTQ